MTIITKEKAFEIANEELKNSYYREKLKNGWAYGWIEFLYSWTNVKVDGREAYFIKVIGG